VALEPELKTYVEKPPELLSDLGKFVLIHGHSVAGTFAAYEDAIQAGYERFGLKPFLVKQTLVEERAQHVNGSFSIVY